MREEEDGPGDLTTGAVLCVTQTNQTNLTNLTNLWGGMQDQIWVA